MATSGGPRSSWRAIGAPTNSCGIWRLSCSSATRNTGIAAIGSGGPYATAAATALAEHTTLSARQIAEEAMKIAGKMCIYTNDRVTIEEL